MTEKFSKSKQKSNKPSWDNAPVWARYLTMDMDGEWLWHEAEPFIWDSGWSSDREMTHGAMGNQWDCESIIWQQSLEVNPKFEDIMQARGSEIEEVGE